MYQVQTFWTTVAKYQQYAATSFQTELCALLLQIGVDPDRTATFGQYVDTLILRESLSADFLV